MSAITVVSPAEKPALTKAVDGAIKLLASPEAQEYRGLKGRGASLLDLRRWADAGAPGPEQNRRRLLIYHDCWGTSGDKVVQAVLATGPTPLIPPDSTPLITPADIARTHAAWGEREPEWQSEWNAAVERIREEGFQPCRRL